MVDSIFDEYPWAKHLPPDARAEFTTDLADAVQASADLDDPSILTRRISEWRATAQIYADPALFRALARPLRCDDGPVRAALTTARWMISTWGGRRQRLGSVLGRR